MQVSSNFVAVAAFLTEIVFYALVSLNIASLAIVAERTTYFWRRRVDVDLLSKQLLHFIKLKELVKARAILARVPAPECAVLMAGVNALEFGSRAADEAMRAALVRERIRMDANLTMLKAVTFAAPSLGALGTLLGLVSVMPHLATPLLSPQGVVGLAVREALGAVAVAAAGLFVGVPAGVATLLLERRVLLSEERSTALMHGLLMGVAQFEHEAARLAAAVAEGAAGDTTPQHSQQPEAASAKKPPSRGQSKGWTGRAA